MALIQTDPFSQAPIYIKLLFNETELATGTAFLYKYRDRTFLVQIGIIIPAETGRRTSLYLHMVGCQILWHVTFLRKPISFKERGLCFH
jgi:hypothetical protein